MRTFRVHPPGNSQIHRVFNLWKGRQAWKFRLTSMHWVPTVCQTRSLLHLETVWLSFCKGSLKRAICLFKELFPTYQLISPPLVTASFLQISLFPALSPSPPLLTPQLHNCFSDYRHSSLETSLETKVGCEFPQVDTVSLCLLGPRPSSA